MSFKHLKLFLLVGLLFAYSLPVMAAVSRTSKAMEERLKKEKENTVLKEEQKQYELPQELPTLNVSALMTAVIDNNLEEISFFAKSRKIDINQKNFGGATALHIAARSGNSEAVKILLEGGAQPNITDNEGWTPLSRAALTRDAKSVLLLLSHGAFIPNAATIEESTLVNIAHSNCKDCLIAIFNDKQSVQYVNWYDLRDQLIEAYTIESDMGNLEAQDMIADYMQQTALPRLSTMTLPKYSVTDIEDWFSFEKSKKEVINSPFIDTFVRPYNSPGGRDLRFVPQSRFEVLKKSAALKEEEVKESEKPKAPLPEKKPTVKKGKPAVKKVKPVTAPTVVQQPVVQPTTQQPTTKVVAPQPAIAAAVGAPTPQQVQPVAKPPLPTTVAPAPQVNVAPAVQKKPAAQPTATAPVAANAVPKPSN